MNQVTELRPDPVWVFGLPLAPFTLDDALARIDRLVETRSPSYFITANLHYAMLADEQPRLRAVNAAADFILADGMPLVWASRRSPTPLPERVAGSDLIWKIAERAAQKGHRLFLLGGGPGVAEMAGERLKARFPTLSVAGTAAPPFRELTPDEHASLIRQIQDSGADILLVAFGQPKGELWIAANYEKLLIPVCVQVGASFDFVAGMVRRAPRWLQRLGLEWAYRLAQEPRRLFGRYVRNARFLFRMLFTRGGRRLRPG